MAALVTLEEAKAHLRILSDDEDPDIQLKVNAASDILLDYIKRPDATWSEGDAPPLVKAATLLMVGTLFNDAAADPLSDSIIRILHRYRDPACA
jgi:hypothetical protein